MEILFYIAALVAIISTAMVITRKNAVHALLYLIVSLLSSAFIFYLLGAPFLAALEVIVYAGAIMILFVFVMMMLNLGAQAKQQEALWLQPSVWAGPSVLAFILLIEFLFVFGQAETGIHQTTVVGAREVGTSLYSKYLVAVELAGMLLMAGVVGAYHLGKRKSKVLHRYIEKAGSL